MVSVSAEHGTGIDDLKKAILDTLGPAPEKEEDADRTINIAFTGRPNVGKSSICNALLQDDRLIVSDIPGQLEKQLKLRLITHPRMVNYINLVSSTQLVCEERRSSIILWSISLHLELKMHLSKLTSSSWLLTQRKVSVNRKK